jgi:Stigma-specific protein, Stig1
VERERFDALTRAVARGSSRRGALKALAGGAVGGLAALAGGGAAAAPRPKPGCCPSGHPVLCGLTCTDTKADPANCGGCGHSCDAGTVCANGVCAAPPCTSPADCGSPNDPCQVATCAGGQCGVGTRNCADGNDCTADVCDRAGCSNPPLPAGTACGQNGGTVCDGNGNCVVCVPGSTQPCFTGPGSPGVGICVAGTQTCRPDGTWGTACAGQVTAQPELCNGLDDDCDGVVDNGFDTQTDPQNCGACGTVCTAQPPCGMTGDCVGGQCAFASTATVCRPATCVGSTALQGAATCDGQGTCPPSTTQDCTPYTCADGACRTSCTTDADCAIAHTCVGGLCQQAAR